MYGFLDITQINLFIFIDIELLRFIFIYLNQFITIVYCQIQIYVCIVCVFKFGTKYILR